MCPFPVNITPRVTTPQPPSPQANSAHLATSYKWNQTEGAVLCLVSRHSVGRFIRVLVASSEFPFSYLHIILLGGCDSICLCILQLMVCFWFVAFMNHAPMGIPVCAFLWKKTFISTIISFTDNSNSLFTNVSASLLSSFHLS